MATTLEGKVKAKVSKILQAAECMYYHMPVPGGFGGTTLDYIGCHFGVFFAIETKKPGGKPTKRQDTIIEAMCAAGGKVFVIDGDTTELEDWLR